MHREPFVKLSPVFKDYLWGGQKLKALYNAKDERIAEAWLVSVHPDGPSIVAEGRYAGMPFPGYLLAEEARDAFSISDQADRLRTKSSPYRCTRTTTMPGCMKNDHGKKRDVDHSGGQ